MATKYNTVVSSIMKSQDIVSCVEMTTHEVMDLVEFVEDVELALALDEAKGEAIMGNTNAAYVVIKVVKG